MNVLMELNQKKGRKDVQNKKLKNAAKPRWGVTADKPRGESERRRDGSEKRKEKIGCEVQKRGRLLKMALCFF
jgi:hypothetical protein